MKSRICGVATCLVLLSAAPTDASVKIKILADGTRVMFNEGPRVSSWNGQPTATEVSRQKIDRLVELQSQRHQIDPALVRAVVEVESAYRPWAMSGKGAMGLMQLMPETARELAVNDPWDPEENLRAGTTYLKHLLDVFGGSLELALAGYNAGPEAVQRYRGIPPYEETRAYVEKVLRLYRGEPGFSLPSSSNLRLGRKAYLTRDSEGNYLLTTSPGDHR